MNVYLWSTELNDALRQSTELEGIYLGGNEIWRSWDKWTEVVRNQWWVIRKNETQHYFIVTNNTSQLNPGELSPAQLWSYASTFMIDEFDYWATWDWTTSINPPAWTVKQWDLDWNYAHYTNLKNWWHVPAIEEWDSFLTLMNSISSNESKSIQYWLIMWLNFTNTYNYHPELGDEERYHPSNYWSNSHDLTNDDADTLRAISGLDADRVTSYNRRTNCDRKKTDDSYINWRVRLFNCANALSDSWIYANSTLFNYNEDKIEIWTNDSALSNNKFYRVWTLTNAMDTMYVWWIINCSSSWATPHIKLPMWFEVYRDNRSYSWIFMPDSPFSAYNGINFPAFGNLQWQSQSWNIRIWGNTITFTMPVREDSSWLSSGTINNYYIYFRFGIPRSWDIKLILQVTRWGVSDIRIRWTTTICFIDNLTVWTVTSWLLDYYLNSNFLIFPNQIWTADSNYVWSCVVYWFDDEWEYATRQFPNVHHSNPWIITPESVNF